MRRSALSIAVLTLACRSGTQPTVQAPAAPPSPAASPAIASSPLPAASPTPVATPSPYLMSDALHWMRNAAEYEAAATQTYRLAAEKLGSVARGKRAGTWAVILDADETVLDNSQYMKERNMTGAAFSPATWHAWTQRKTAGTVPGAPGFLRRVHELGGRIAIVTNRAASECADTEQNLKQNDLPYDVILCNPDVRVPSKEPRFEQVQQGTTAAGLPPLEVVMWIGDNINDFPGMSQEAKGSPDRFKDFGSRFFVLPNPTYGSWERSTRQ